MRSITRIIMLWCILTASLSFPAHTANEELPDLENKVALELGLEKRLKAILKEITGTDRISLSVTVHLFNQKEKVTFKPNASKKKKPQEMVLPGVPLQDTYSDTDAVLAPLTFEENRTMIKRLTVNIFLDSNVPDDIYAMVERVSRALLGINPDRGDKLVIERIPFGRWDFEWKKMLMPPDLYKVLALALGMMIFLFGILFMFGPFRAFFVQFVGSIETLAEKSKPIESAAGPSAGAAGALGLAMQQSTGASAGGGKDDGPKRPFSFINTSSLGDLVFLCKKQSTESIATMVSYLNPNLAARLVAELEPSVQGEVTKKLANMQEKEPEKVKVLEKMIREKIDFLVGGEDRLQQIINYSDNALQQTMLSSLKEANPSFAEKLKKQMFVFEDIIKLDVNTQQMLIRNINPMIFAQVLKSMPEDFQKKILLALPQGLAERLEQEMDLGKPLLAKRIEEEKRVIVQLVKKFEQQGLIDLSALA